MRSRIYFEGKAMTTIVVVLLLCFAGMGSLKAQNITLVSSNKPPQASSGFGDVWAEGNIACMGVWTAYSTFGVGIYDISNPALPNLLTVYNYSSNTGNRLEQGAIRNRILYVGAWDDSDSTDGVAASGLHILSLTNPASPVLLSRITKNTPGTITNGFDDVHTMFLERDFLYEAAHVDNVVSVKVFNVTNPFVPVFLWDVVTTNTFRVHQITVAKKGTNTILYTSGWGTGSALGQTDIWDVSNVGTQPPRWQGRVFSGSSSHSSWPSPDGNALVVCRETTGGEVTIYDISTPTNPVALSVISAASIGLEANIPHNPVVVSNLLFLSWYQNGLQIFDISDRTKPVRIGSFDTYAPARTQSFQGNWGVYPDLGLNKVLVSDINNGFLILDASAVLTNTNSYPPLLVRSPASVTTTNGMEVSLSATVTGSLLKYQWRFNGSDLAGATNSNLTFNSVKSTNSGNYFVISSNAFGSVTSAVATLSVVVQSNSIPQITAHPQNVSIYAQQSATFSVAVVGDAPFSYQWRLNGANIMGATNSLFTRLNVSANDVGSYSAYVENSFGSVISSNALLTIIDSPFINGVRFGAGLRSAAIVWNTTLPTDGRVDYGPTSAGGITGSSPTDSTLSTNHSILLSGLAEGTAYSFQIVSRAGGSNFISAVYTFTTAGGAIILDDTNSAVTFSGTWGGPSVNVPGYYGSGYRFASVSASNLRTATFTPTIPVAGNYDVYTRYTASTDRPTNAPYTIFFDGGFTPPIRLNQTTGGGTWHLLSAEVPFSAGTSGSVQLANNAGPTGRNVIADAVQFIYSDQDFPTNGTVPTWWSDFYFGGTTSPNLDADGDGFTTGQEYILGTSPILSDQTFEVETFRSGGSANIIFGPMLADRSYTLLRSTNLVSGWQPVAINPTPSGSSGQGVFSLSIGSTNQAFYRISVQLNEIDAGLTSSLLAPPVRPFAGLDAEPTCGPNRIYVK